MSAKSSSFRFVDQGPGRGIKFFEKGPFLIRRKALHWPVGEPLSQGQPSAWQVSLRSRDYFFVLSVNAADQSRRQEASHSLGGPTELFPQFAIRVAPGVAPCLHHPNLRLEE